MKKYDKLEKEMKDKGYDKKFIDLVKGKSKNMENELKLEKIANNIVDDIFKN